MSVFPTPTNFIDPALVSGRTGIIDTALPAGAVSVFPAPANLFAASLAGTTLPAGIIMLGETLPDFIFSGLRTKALKATVDARIITVRVFLAAAASIEAVLIGCSRLFPAVRRLPTSPEALVVGCCCTFPASDLACARLFASAFSAFLSTAALSAGFVGCCCSFSAACGLVAAVDTGLVDCCCSFPTGSFGLVFLAAAALSAGFVGCCPSFSAFDGIAAALHTGIEGSPTAFRAGFFAVAALTFSTLFATTVTAAPGALFVVTTGFLAAIQAGLIFGFFATAVAAAPGAVFVVATGFLAAVQAGPILVVAVFVVIRLVRNGRRGLLSGAVRRKAEAAPWLCTQAKQSREDETTFVE